MFFSPQVYNAIRTLTWHKRENWTCNYFTCAQKLEVIDFNICGGVTLLICQRAKFTTPELRAWLFFPEWENASQTSNLSKVWAVTFVRRTAVVEMSEQVLWLGFVTVSLLLQGCLCQQRLRGYCCCLVKTLRHSPTVTRLLDGAARRPEVLAIGE